MFRVLGFASLLGLALSAPWIPAVAADLKAPPAAAAPLPEVLPAYAFSWTGAYAGIHGGWRQVEGSGPGGSTLSAESLVGGLQGGLNYQLPSGVMLGVEGDVTYGNAKDTLKVDTRRIDGGIDWAGSLRGRLGYAFDRFLVFGTGGLALGHFDATAFDTTLPGVRAGTDETLAGWTAGLGAEYGLTDRVTFGAQYRYSDLGDVKVKTPGGGRETLDVKTHDFRFGLNWKF